MFKSLLRAACMAAALLAPHAGSLAMPATPFQLLGPTFKGDTFSLAQRQGRVVMVVYWATDCAVCRDKLPELRRNLAGWAHQPFDLVMVSLDKREVDWRRYEDLQTLTQAKAVQRGVAMWAGAPGFRHSLSQRPAQLPLTLVFGPDGQEHARVAGRVPPELWDTVAELLP
jgi:thiol-disulfide isomerase/thioredoxin